MSSRLSILLACALAIAVQAVADPIDQCGFIIQELECSFFYPLAGGGVKYAIDVSSVPDSFLVTLHRVVGDAVPCERMCNGDSVNACIINYQISLCPSTDLGCGVLINIYDPYFPDRCWIWLSPVYGPLVTHRHGFVAGDTVHVAGIVDYTSFTYCGVGDGYLWNEVFTACADSGSATQEATWGRLKFLFRR